MQLLAALLLCLSVIFVNALEDDELEEKPIQHPAQFTTLPQHSMVNAGGTIRLPCFVDKIEGYILLWKFGETILSVGGRVIDSSERKARLASREAMWTRRLPDAAWRSMEAQTIKDRVCLIQEVKEPADTQVEYKDILSLTIIFQLWHVADNIFKHLDAVSLLNCEKVT